MKKIIASGLFSLSLFTVSFAGFAADFKIATVDLSKVRDSYYKYMLARSSLSNHLAARDLELNKMEDDLRKVQDQGRQSLDNQNNQAFSAEARAKYKTNTEALGLQLQIRGESITNYYATTQSKFSDEWVRHSNDIITEIRGVMDALARKQGYTLVLDRTALTATGYPTVLYTSGENDLTEVLIKELNSTAPPPPAPEVKSPADNSRGAKPTPQ